MDGFDVLQALGWSLAEAKGLRGEAAEANARKFATGRDGSERAAREAWEAATGPATLDAAVQVAIETEQQKLGVTRKRAEDHIRGWVSEKAPQVGADRMREAVVEYTERLRGAAR